MTVRSWGTQTPPDLIDHTNDMTNAHGPQKPLLQLGGSLGTAGGPGGTYEDAAGVKWYLKNEDDPERIKNDLLATDLYRLAGIKVPDAYEINMNGIPHLASRWIPAIRDPHCEAPGVTEGFAVDAWLANWDVLGVGDNTLKTLDEGDAVRVDMGGSMQYHGVGALKGDLFGNTVGEIVTLRDENINPIGCAAFGQMTDEQVKDSARRVTSISDIDIINAVQSRYGDTESGRDLATKLIARRDSIETQVLLGSNVPKPSHVVNRDMTTIEWEDHFRDLSRKLADIEQEKRLALLPPSSREPEPAPGFSLTKEDIAMRPPSKPDSMTSVQEAVTDYRRSMVPDTDPRLDHQSMEYLGMSKNPSYTPRQGRGRRVIRGKLTL